MPFEFFFFDWTFFILIPSFLLAMLATARVRGSMNKYSQVATKNGMKGADVALDILAKNGIKDVAVERLDSNSGDHYDPRDRTVRLSAPVHDSSCITAVAVAAHEAGHAIQHSTSYTPLSARNGFFPVVRFASGAAIPLILVGFLITYLDGLGGFSGILIDLGIMFFAATVLFHLITLPVEYNASKRAMAALESGRYLTIEEMRGAKRVLGAAALTYVAAAFVALSQLIRLIIIARRR